MGKQKRKKATEPKSPPPNSVNWQRVAHDLYQRGLISRVALGASSPADRADWPTSGAPS